MMIEQIYTRIEEIEQELEYLQNRTAQQHEHQIEQFRELQTELKSLRRSLELYPQPAHSE